MSRERKNFWAVCWPSGEVLGINGHSCIYDTRDKCREIAKEESVDGKKYHVEKVEIRGAASDWKYEKKEEISLRDFFAAAALQGLLAACDGPAWGTMSFPVADSCYAYADSMLKARVKNAKRN